MSLPLQFLGALILTFFISRVTVRLPLPLQTFRRLALAHALAFALSTALIVTLRAPHGHFHLLDLAPLVAMELLWLFMDRIQHNLPEWG